MMVIKKKMARKGGIRKENHARALACSVGFLVTKQVIEVEDKSATSFDALERNRGRERN